MKELLKLARDAIESELNQKKLIIPETLKSEFSKKQACFVTLTENNELKGCIGSLEPRQELWKDVAENAVHAAFNDFRFSPLSKEDLKKIKIEISVLTIPKKLEYRNEQEILKKINNSMGIILKKSMRSATFLPQVWKQIPDKTEFLEELSLKAGLRKDDWKNSEVLYYTVKSIEE